MKIKLSNLFVLALFVTILSACKSDAAKTEIAAFNLDSAKAAIAASNQAFSESWGTGDSVKFVNCYATDGIMSPPNMPALSGTAAITAFFNEGYKWGIRNVAVKTSDVFGNADCVVETGTYELFMENNVSGDKGKYIVMWKPENGTWKMFRDVWNSDLPCPPPPPSTP